MATTKHFRLALTEARRQNPNVSDEDLDDEAQAILDEWASEFTHDCECLGEPYDTDCIEAGRDNCDDWGTGEGQYHGRI